MALVMNASSKEQTVQVHGAWFTFAPGAIKEMNDNKVAFLSSNKAYLGFVAVPEKFGEVEERNSPEGKRELEELKAAGITNRIKHLEWLRNNEMQSLRQDMDKKSIKAETETEMSTDSFAALKGALEELKGYKSKTADTVKQRAAELKELAAALTDEE